MVWVAFGMAGVALALASRVMEKNKKFEKRIKDLEEKMWRNTLKLSGAIQE